MRMYSVVSSEDLSADTEAPRGLQEKTLSYPGFFAW